MSCTMEIWENEGIIFVKNQGKYTVDDLFKQISRLLEEVKERNIYNILVDDTEMVSMLSLSDIKHLPDLYRLLRVPKQGRLALVFSENTFRATNLSFYEKIASGQGYTVKLFPEIDAAKAWLQAANQEEATPSPAKNAQRWLLGLLSQHPDHGNNAKK